jgi:urease accessory protein
MLCETILGSLADFPGKKADYVTVEWHERRKKLHRKTSAGGADIAIRLGDTERGLRQDDVIGIEGDTVYAVDIPAFEVVRITTEAGGRRAAETVCWETGNRHAPLFGGEAEGEFLAPWDEPLEKLLGKIRGVKTEKTTRRVDFSRELSRGEAHDHRHGH